MDIDDDSLLDACSCGAHPRQGRPRGPEGCRPHLPVRLPRGRPGLCEAVGPEAQRKLHPHRRLRREEAHLPGGEGAPGRGPVRLCPRPPHGGEGALRLFRQRPQHLRGGLLPHRPRGRPRLGGGDRGHPGQGHGLRPGGVHHPGGARPGHRLHLPAAPRPGLRLCDEPPVQAAQGLFRRQLPGTCPGWPTSTTCCGAASFSTTGRTF